MASFTEYMIHVYMLHICIIWVTSTHIRTYTYILYMYHICIKYILTPEADDTLRSTWGVEMSNCGLLGSKRAEFVLFLCWIYIGVWKHVNLYTLKPKSYTCIHNITMDVRRIYFSAVAMTMGHIILCMYVHTYATYMYWNWSLLKALSNLPPNETHDCSSFVKIADPTRALLPTNITETYR